MMSDVKYLSVEELIESNSRVLSEINVRKADRHEVLSRATLTWILGEVEKLPGDIFDKATVLLAELVRKHCFGSGNKRTAYAATHLFLKANGKELNAVQNPRILIGIREGFYNNDEIKNWLMGHAIREFTRK